MSLEEDLIQVLEGIADMYLNNIGETIALLERLLPHLDEETQKNFPNLKEMREIRASQELYVREIIRRAKESSDGI